jgi:DDE_Tnp_1-associated
MVPFQHLVVALPDVPDPRRAEEQRYGLVDLLLFTVLALLSGARSYRGVTTFMGCQRQYPNAQFGGTLKRARSVNTLRTLLQNLDPAALETAFRQHAASLLPQPPAEARMVVALDGKTLRGSFDHMEDHKAAPVLSAFACEAALLLAQTDIADKDSEIPAAQALVAELGLSGVPFTVDALHCQKNLRGGKAEREYAPGPSQGQPTGSA